MEDRCYINPFQPKVCSTKSASSDDTTKIKDTENSSRSEMRDSYSLAIGCVFDGHNGDYVAEFLKEKFAVRLQNSLFEEALFISINKGTFCETLDSFEQINDLSKVKQMKHYNSTLISNFLVVLYVVASIFGHLRSEHLPVL